MKNKSIITLILFFTISFSAVSQYYDGSAYVYVKDKNGNSRCIMSAYSASGRDLEESSATVKGWLVDGLERQISDITNEKMTSHVYYNVSRVDNNFRGTVTKENPEYHYDGVGSVKIVNDRGETSFITREVECYQKSLSPGRVMKLIISHLKDVAHYSDADFVDPIKFEINKCGSRTH